MPMKTLLVMRHAKSDWSVAEGTPDAERPLTRRGKRDAEAMAGHLARLGQIPDLVVHSPARRCRSTVKRLIAAWPPPAHAGADERLYMHGVAGCVAAVACLPDESARALVVGHNPALEDFVETLTGRRVVLPTTTVACLRLPIDRWQEVDALPQAQVLFVMGPDGTMVTDESGSLPG